MPRFQPGNILTVKDRPGWIIRVMGVRTITKLEHRYCHPIGTEVYDLKILNRPEHTISTLPDNETTATTYIVDQDSNLYLPNKESEEIHDKLFSESEQP